MATAMAEEAEAEEVDDTSSTDGRDVYGAVGVGGAASEEDGEARA